MSFLDYCDQNYEAAKTNDFENLPLGTYLCSVDDVTIREETDFVTLNFKMSVVGDKFQGRKIFKHHKITVTEDMRPLKFAYSDLRKLGFMGKIGELRAKPDVIIGQTIEVSLTQSKNPDFPFINLKQVKSPARAAEAAAAAAAQPPAPVSPPVVPANDIPF